MQKVKKAVIPVAGFGTRMLPATKAMPKKTATTPSTGIGRRCSLR